MRDTLRYRSSVAARVVLAALGGYGMAAVSTALLALHLPQSRAEAVTTATLASFLVMALVACWVFAARSLLAAAVSLGLPLAMLSLWLWLDLRAG